MRCFLAEEVRFYAVHVKVPNGALLLRVVRVEARRTVARGAVRDVRVSILATSPSPSAMRQCECNIRVLADRTSAPRLL